MTKTAGHLAPVSGLTFRHTVLLLLLLHLLLLLLLICRCCCRWSSDVFSRYTDWSSVEIHVPIQAKTSGGHQCQHVVFGVRERYAHMKLLWIALARAAALA